MSRVCLDALIKSDESGFACSKGKLVESGLPHLRPFNVSNDGRLDLSEVYQVPETEAPLGKTYLDAGDILFNNTNSAELVGKSALVQSAMRAGFSNHMNRIRLDRNQIEPAYFAFWLKRQRDTGFFTSQATQWVSQAAYKTSEMRKLEIDLPTLPEQHRIVDLLSRAEGIVRLRREAEKKAAELIPALFLDMFGDPATNPKGWPMVRLGDLAEKMSDGPFGSNLKTSHYVETGVRVIRLQNIGIGELIDDAKAYVSPEHFASLPRHRCLPDDVIIGTLGDPNLRAFVLPSTIPEALNKADCVQFRCRQSVVSPAYICWLMNMPSTLAMAASLVQGITLTRISMGRLREMLVPVPPFDAQQVFADRVEMMNSIKSQQSAATAKAQATFDALLAKAFS